MKWSEATSMAGHFRLVIEKNRLGSLPAETRRKLSQVVRKAAFDVEAQAKVNAPVDTGFLRNSIQAEMKGELTAEVTVGAEYGVLVEFGTGVHSEFPGAPKQPIVIEPKDKKALFWEGAEHPVGRVVIQGSHPQPFLGPAVEALRPVFPKAVEAALKDSE
ncbi:MAG TPA: HK97-gp10 family putative phage morphogenesis protein [Armatimonadota bacterium]|nr:HK97-gp10 family putative phage morphogenesis protein [Armatimonadota bacterium]